MMSLARLVFLLALACSVSAQKWTLTEFDDFNIEDGNPSDFWVMVPQAPQQPPGGFPQVFNHKLCGSTQSIALFARNGTSPGLVRFTYTFEASTLAGFETYLVALQAANTSNVMLIGCSGGYQGQGFCSPVMRSMSDLWPPVLGVPQPLLPHRTYVIQIFMMSKANAVMWTLMNSFGESLYSFSGQVPNLMDYTQGGILVGRRGLTCVDDFRLEEADA